MYIAGFVIPVPEDKIEAYRQWAEDGAAIFKEYGCVEIVESWEYNVRAAGPVRPPGGGGLRCGLARLFTSPARVGLTCRTKHEH
jgi:hypothetical protein